MRLIVQHNYTSGHGDGIMAMIDYMNTVSDLKKLGFNGILKMSLARNFYFKNTTPLDYIDKKSFEMFDEIEITENPFTNVKQDGYTCVFTHAGASPAAHYWDLYIDDDSVNYFNENYKIKQYHMGGLVNGDLPLFFPKFNFEILEKYENLKIKNNIKKYNAIHFRTQDLQEELDFLEKNKNKIKKIVENSNKLFICSNSIEFKKYVKSLKNDNVFYWELPLEEEIGGNHLEHYKLEGSILHERNIFTFLDMWTLGNAKEIFFFTTWKRHSNFLVFGPLNKSVIYYNE